MSWVRADGCGWYVGGWSGCALWIERLMLTVKLCCLCWCWCWWTVWDALKWLVGWEVLVICFIPLLLLKVWVDLKTAVMALSLVLTVALLYDNTLTFGGIWILSAVWAFVSSQHGGHWLVPITNFEYPFQTTSYWRTTILTACTYFITSCALLW